MPPNPLNGGTPSDGDASILRFDSGTVQAQATPPLLQAPRRAGKAALGPHGASVLNAGRGVTAPGESVRGDRGGVRPRLVLLGRPRGGTDRAH